MNPYAHLTKCPSQNKLAHEPSNKDVYHRHLLHVDDNAEWGFFVDLETYQYVNQLRSNRQHYLQYPYNKLNPIYEDDDYKWEDADKLHGRISRGKSIWVELYSVLVDKKVGIMIIADTKGIVATFAGVCAAWGICSYIGKYV